MSFLSFFCKQREATSKVSYEFRFFLNYIRGFTSLFAKLVEEFSKNQKSGIIQFTEIGNFNNKVLFLKPEKDEFLSEINKKLHEFILPKFEKGENGYYTPENWVPHTTLATRLNQKQHTEILNIASKIKLPLESNISEVAVYQCSPFAELKRFDLKG